MIKLHRSTRFLNMLSINSLIRNIKNYNHNVSQLRYFAKAVVPKKVTEAARKSPAKKQAAAPVKKTKTGIDEKKKEADAINNFIKAIEDTKKIKLEYTPEEMENNAKIAKEYQRQCNALYRLRSKDLSNKIWLQQEALKAMPLEFREHALICDETPPPPDRPWPYWDTPPIPGFNVSEYTNGMP